MTCQDFMDVLARRVDDPKEGNRTASEVLAFEKHRKECDSCDMFCMANYRLFAPVTLEERCEAAEAAKTDPEMSHTRV